jgi:hypothetical protein
MAFCKWMAVLVAVLAIGIYWNHRSDVSARVNVLLALQDVALLFGSMFDQRDHAVIRQNADGIDWIVRAGARRYVYDLQALVGARTKYMRTRD